MSSKTIANMTDREILDTLQADTPLSRVYRICSTGYAEIEQARNQLVLFQHILNEPPFLMELRRMELQIANNILELFGIALS